MSILLVVATVGLAVAIRDYINDVRAWWAFHRARQNRNERWFG